MFISRKLRFLCRIETAWKLVTSAAMFVIVLKFVADAFGLYVFDILIPWANVLSF
jgi:hypothetical protein